MNPRGKHEGNKTREEKSAKVRDKAVSKLEAKGNDTAYDAALGAALQQALRENA